MRQPTVLVTAVLAALLGFAAGVYALPREPALTILDSQGQQAPFAPVPLPILEFSGDTFTERLRALDLPSKAPDDSVGPGASAGVVYTLPCEQLLEAAQLDASECSHEHFPAIISAQHWRSVAALATHYLGIERTAERGAADQLTLAEFIAESLSFNESPLLGGYQGSFPYSQRQVPYYSLLSAGPDDMAFLPLLDGSVLVLHALNTAHSGLLFREGLELILPSA